MLPTIATGNVGSALAGEYEVANSLRYNGSDVADALTKSISSTSSVTKSTYSAWVKRSELGRNQHINYVESGGRYSEIYFNTSDQILIFHYHSATTQAHLVTSRVFRDVSAWYHIVVAFDSTQGTASNRIKLYVNGVQETSFGTETYPSSSADLAFNTSGQTHNIGNANLSASLSLDGYLTEVCWIDGQQLDPTSFGEFDEDTGIWKPIDVSDLTFGTNGFYLDFENSGSLGADVSGNGNNFTVNNLTSIDQSTDTCTNNFCTMNSLVNASGSTFSEGNLKVATVTSNASLDMSTFGLTQGKWYWEVKATTLSTGGSASERNMVGITKTIPTVSGYDGSMLALGVGLRGNGIIAGVIGSGQSGWNTYVQGDIISVALDLDNGKLYFATNGTYGNSSNPSTASNGYSFTVGTDTYFPAVNVRETSESGTWELNFGNPPFTISSGNSDGNGYGNFEYAVPSSYYSLCTKNLAEYG